MTDTAEQKSIIEIREVEKLKDYLATIPRLLVFAHANPDGDTMGGALALTQGLKSIGLSVTMACMDAVPDYLQFLSGTSEVVQDIRLSDFDGFCFVDCAESYMVGYQKTYPELLEGDLFRINIDHHASNNHFGTINFVPIEAASSTEVVFRLLQELEIKVTPAMATALLLGLYTDTGAFMHQNTTPQSYQVGAELVSLGANVTQISRHVFRSYDVRTLKLWARALQNLHLTPDGAAIVGISREDYDDLGAKRSDLAGVIDFINSMPDAKYSVLLSEDEKGNVKASLRTRKPDVDVKAVAEKYGGGGHIKASGFTIAGSHLQKEVKWKIVREDEEDD